MKGIPIEGTKVRGELQETAINVIYERYNDIKKFNGFASQFERLKNGEIRLNGLAGLLNKFGYYMEIQIKCKGE